MSRADNSSLLQAMDQAFHELPCGVLVLEAREDAFVAVHVNAAFAQLTGQRLDENTFDALAWIGTAVADSDAQQQLRTALRKQRAVSIESDIGGGDAQTRRWCRLTAKPLGAHRDAVRVLVMVEDLTEQKRTRESLRASEGRLEVAMEAERLAMWDWHVTSDRVYYNDVWNESLGIDPATLLTRTELSERLMLPADQPAILAQFEQHFFGRTSAFRAEYALQVGNERRWFEAYAKVVRRDRDGKALRMVGVLSDLSAWRSSIEEAARVQQQWERAVRGTCDGLYDWDLLTGHVWYAQRFRQIVGCNGDDFPDTFAAFQNVLHAEDRPKVLAKIRAHLENHAPLEVRCRVVTREGQVLWCRLRGEAERDAAGRPLRLAGSLSDISEQIEAEQALDRSQDFYGTILDSLPLFIAYADRDERLVYANRMFQEFFAVTLAQTHGRVINDVIGDRRYGAIGPYVREALSGRAMEGQGRFRAVSGRVLDLDAAFLPHRDERGEIQGCIVAARDMTEKRLLEAELRQSQKMEAIGRLTGGIAHDFNNLLSVIVGNMQLLARSLRQSPRLLRQTETALSAAMRGADLTRRLLAFARQQVLEPKVVDLNALIAGMYEILRRALTGDIDIQQQLGAELWATKVDPSQLENAVLNLVINARDAMPEGGTICIKTRNLTLGAERTARDEPLAPGEYVLLEVTDTGTGMTPQTLKRVFEPFFTTKDVGKGSGLGLSMVYGFMKQSGGHVQITSAPNMGTSVHLYFPRTHAKPTAANLPADSLGELPRGRETLLVVEDNAEVRRTAVDILQSLGYRLLEAGNGQEALEQFMRNPQIALVFSDVMLPSGMLGTQLVQKLRERRPALKVLMTSGYNESGIIHRGLLDGSIEVLPKPYQVEELARRVRAKLDGAEESTHVSA